MKIVMVGMLVCISLVIGLADLVLTAEYGVTEATVKVLEVGERYLFLTSGQQYYVRVQNAYSDQYASSSESWETCIEEKDVESLNKAKNERKAINIRVEGYGLSTRFRCLTGDRITEMREAET